MEISYKKRKLKIPVKKVSFVGKVTGLMFRTRNTKNLLFEFKKEVSYPFHSIYVFFPFLIIWLDEKNSVVDFRISNPFMIRIKSKKPYTKVIEVPLNSKNSKIVDFFVGKRKI